MSKASLVKGTFSTKTVAAGTLGFSQANGGVPRTTVKG